MPLPNPYDIWKDNESQYGAVSPKSYRAGRVSWTGNQRRPFSRFEPPTACSSQIDRFNTETFRRDFSNGRVRSGWLPFVYNSSSVVSTTTEPSDDDGLVAQAKAMRSFSSNTGFAETVAETPSTLRLVGRRAGLIFNILRIAGKGHFREAGQLLSRSTGYNVSNRSIKRLERKFGKSKSYDSRRASSFWLEYQFGFAPLFQSVYDSFVAFSSQKRTHRKSAFSNGASYGLYASVENRESFDAARLGVTNPALLVWNLLPFSFVVDWFLPISAALAWIGSRQGLGTVYAWSAKMRIRTQTINGIFWSERKNYTRSVQHPPVITDLFKAGPRSHGLWTVITTLSLVNSLR